MSSKIEFWNFIAFRLSKGEQLILLIVAESTGSSPGRCGYKMAVASDGELCGSIGGGVMEVRLVERARAILSEPPSIADGFTSQIIEQIHRKDSPDASGMICSGQQTVIIRSFTHDDLQTVQEIVECLQNGDSSPFEISNAKFEIVGSTQNERRFYFGKTNETEFVYQERVGSEHNLYIVGGGHCALALSELASKLGFRISIFDDRPELNTIAKNDFAETVDIIDSYENIAEFIPTGDDVYVVVMTLGYASDAVVIRKLIDREVKYFGVLGSKAKMAPLMKELKGEGFDLEKLARISTPIGLPINSRTPEEIAVSIAAEIISVKNAG
ncbi:MAG: XdhC family protein [Pyrinomonadaceae bacterium]